MPARLWAPGEVRKRTRAEQTRRASGALGARALPRPRLRNLVVRTRDVDVAEGHPDLQCIAQDRFNAVLTVHGPIRLGELIAKAPTAVLISESSGGVGGVKRRRVGSLGQSNGDDLQQPLARKPEFGQTAIDIPFLPEDLRFNCAHQPLHVDLFDHDLGRKNRHESQ